MKVHEIAKLTGVDAGVVLTDLGLEGGTGAHLRVVDDAQAKAYLASKGVTLTENTPKVARKARFWCANRRNFLPKREDATVNGIVVKGETRNDIRFKDWVYECDGDSEDAKFLRSQDVRDKLRIFEVVAKPYADAGKAADFIRFLEAQIYTGQTPVDGASREGRNSVQAMLFADMAQAMPKGVKNSPRGLTRAVAGLVSMNVESFGTEELR